MSETIIYTHFGISDYLSRTLECAAFTNPGARRVLIGDQDNISVARAAGWEHVHSEDFQTDLRREFANVFRWIQGKRHGPLRQGRDWLGYCFERYFIIHAYCMASRIRGHWFFDSDVMILVALDQFGTVLRQNGIKHTRQCNDTCLKGYFETETTGNYCQYIIELFKDERFLAEQQRLYNEVHPDWAFTDMTAFDLYVRRNAVQGVHLEAYFDGWWFDDAMCQDDDFDMVMLRSHEPTRVKDIRFADGKFLGLRMGEQRQFAVLNCSWVPLGVFDWILERVQRPQREVSGPEEKVSEPWFGLGMLSLATVRRIKRYLELRCSRK